jgi:shikimate kinase
MGAGKTTVGRRAARLLGRPFVDCDEAFIPRFGRTVVEVFRADGEPAFRALESEMLGELVAVDTPLVVATGGGVVVRPENRLLLRSPDVLVFYLHAEPAFLASRAEEKEHRFLFAGNDPRVVLDRLYADRDAWYREVADEVLEVASFHEWGSSPKRAMAQRIASIVAEREAAA